MRKRIGTFFGFALAFALFAAPVGADDGKVKGLWIEIPGLPEARSTSFNVQSDGEGEAYFERDFDDGLKISIERIYAEDRNGEALAPGDTGKLVLKLQSLRKGIKIDPDDVEITESVEELEEIYSYPVAIALYTTGEDEDMRGNQDILIFTDKWIFRVHLSLAADRMEGYDADEMKDWFVNMKIVDRYPSRANESEDESQDRHALRADSGVEGLWLRIPDFPDDAEVIEFTADDGGEVTYIRALDDGALVLGIYRTPAGDETTPEKVKESIVKSVKDSGGDADDIEFDAGAEDFAELLSYPCMTAEYKIGEDEDAKRVAILGVFTDDYVFLVQAAGAADTFGEYSDRSEEWFTHMKLVDGEEGKGDAFGDKTGEDDEKTLDFVAVVYSLPEFRGIAWHIPAPGKYDLGKGFDMPNDSVSSVAVCPGYKVTLYEHSQFGGETAEFEDNEGDLGERSRWASSLKVERLEEPDFDLAFEWVMVQAENEGLFEEIDLHTAAAAKALEAHAERVERFKKASEMHWYGTTTDAERVELGGELIKIFGDMGVATDRWEANTFAQAMNNFYDWRKDLSVWDAACMILNVDPEIFKQ
jgi:hypothetical protein